MTASQFVAMPIPAKPAPGPAISEPPSVAAAAAPEQSPPQAVPPIPPQSLRLRAIHSSVWTLIDTIGSNGLRLVSTLILTRLLLPDQFGLMSVVNVVLLALHMFSDVGIGPSLIQHRRGGESGFLNTAWTVQIYRGIGLWLCACALAWPVAAYRGEPLFLWLLPIAGLSAVITGFNATSVVRLQRDLHLGRITFWGLAQHIVLVASTALCAWMWPSVWALVIGGLIGDLFWLVISHTVLALEKAKLCWDREAIAHLVRFGRWIFIGTALTFVVNYGDRVILTGYFSDEDLGFYHLATGFALLLPNLVRTMTSRVLFPVYARILEQSADTLHEKMRKVRSILLLVSLPPLCVIAVLSDVIIHVLFRQEYWDAAWMLRILALGGIMTCINVISTPVLLAVGDSFRHMIYLILSSVALVACMLIGGWLGGKEGLLIGVAVSALASYPAAAWAVKRYDAWMPWQDVAAVAGCAIFIGVGLLII